MPFTSNAVRIAAVSFLGFAAQHVAQAVAVTRVGTFFTDDQVFEQTLIVTTAQTISFFTTSYGGGINADGTTTAAGGFVPVLTLFSGTNGKVLATDGGSGICSGSERMDPVTRRCDDAFFTLALAPATYYLDLTEFPNVAVDQLNSQPRFLFEGTPNITGQVCGSASGRFLEADISPCVQRTSAFAVSVFTVPEPGTLMLFLPAAGAFAFFRRRRRD